MKRCRFVLGFAIVALLGVVLLGCAPEAPTPGAPSPGSELPTIHWTFQVVEFSHDDWTVTANDNFSSKVAERTGGKFSIRVALGNELGIQMDEFVNALGEGAVEMAWISSGSVEGAMPFEAIYSLPFLIRTDTDAIKVKHATDFIRTPILQKLGVTEITPDIFSVFAPQELGTREPIADLTDLDGLKIRVWRSSDAKLLEALNAKPLYMPLGDVYMGLQHGAIDGVVTGCECYLNTSFHEVAKYYYSIQLAPGLCLMPVNTEAYEALPEEYRTILREEATSMIQVIREKRPLALEDAYNRLISHGVQIFYLTDEEAKVWQEKARPIWEEWTKGDPQFQEVYDAALEAIGL